MVASEWEMNVNDMDRNELLWWVIWVEKRVVGVFEEWNMREISKICEMCGLQVRTEEEC